MDKKSTVAFDDERYKEVLAAGDEEAYRTLEMTPKVPPAFDGHIQAQSYLAFEENAEAWMCQNIEVV